MDTTRFLNLQHTPSNTSTMKKFLNTPLSAVLLLLIILPACKSSNDSPLSHSGYHQRVAAFTSALLPTNGSITVEFTDNVTAAVPGRSEERRVGKEGRSRGSPCHEKKRVDKNKWR